jgi:Tol biopolymer transport system component
VRRALLTLLAAVAVVPVLPAHAAAPGRNGLLAYDDDTGGAYHLVVADAQGRHPRRLAMDWALWPSWSPDGKWIAFSAATPAGDDGVYVIRPDGSGLRLVGTAPGGYYTPSWSPDGRWLVAAHFLVDDPLYVATEASEVVVLPVHGEGARTVATVPGAYAWSPVWSPKGDVIVFTAEQDAYDQNSDADVNPGLIESVHADGTGLQVIGRGSTPDISPDGRSIAYTAEPTELAGGEQVHVMTIDGKQDRVLGSFGWYGYWTRFTPDGKSVLCEGQDVAHGPAHLYRLDLATGKRVPLGPTGRFDQILPSQQPVRGR